MMKRLLLPLLAICSAAAQSGAPVGKFQQLDQMLPTPNAQRIASGAAGAVLSEAKSYRAIRSRF